MIGDMQVSLASHWAEGFFYEGDISTGPSSDLKAATSLAKMILFGAALAQHKGVFERDEVDNDVWVEEIDTFVEEVYNDMAAFMEPRKDQVIAVANLLDQKNTVDGEEIHALLERLEG
jgi:ATP-dependent Zn protease